MSILRPQPVSTEHFTFDRASNLMTVEISTLGVGFDRVYDDACDEGLTLVSKTGREVVYAIVDEARADGDLLYWELKPVRPGDRALPTVRIFND